MDIDVPSQRRWHGFLRSFAVALALVGGCAPVDEAEIAAAEAPLIGGSATSDHPEVGYTSLNDGLQSCTATLIHPQAIVTAAHCLGFRSCEEPGCGQWKRFNIQRGGTVHSYRIVRVRAFLTDPTVGSARTSEREMALRDVAVAWLDTPVPATVAVPSSIASAPPPRGTMVDVYGYGCTSRCANPGPSHTPTKRVAQTPYGQVTATLCYGDSGGPTLDSAGRVIRITSGFDDRSFDDIYSDPIRYRSEILAQIDAWSRSGASWSWTPSSVVPCSTHDGDCGACVAQSRGLGQCYYCPDTGSCTDRSSTCGAGGHRTYQAQCDEGYTAEAQIDANRCADATSCTDCGARYQCGWDSALSRCVYTGGGSVPGVSPATLIRFPACCGLAGATVCDNDGVCDRIAGEGYDNCRADCPTRAACDNDGVCETADGEDATVCRSDCTVPTTCNGNSLCEPDLGEWCGCGDCPCSTRCDRDRVCEYEIGETASSCAADCGPACTVDGTCNSLRGESPMSCPADCGIACNSDGVCNRAGGETHASCAADCPDADGSVPACDGDGRCEPPMETSTLCPVECPPPTTSCNRDGVCQPELAETSVVCPSDCPRSVCVADRRCDTAAGETPANCPADCTDSGMTRFCNGNGVCELELGESPDRCPRDCPRSATFTDVGGHPARTDIEGLGTLGVVAGYGDGTFRPDAFITRAEFAAIIAQAFLRARTEDVAPFTDVPNEHWASPYIARAAAAGFLHGYPDGTFRPSQRISRQEALVALASGLRMSAAAFSAVERAFTDASSTASWARDGVGRAVGAGILGNADLLAHGGGARLLRPTADATRGEIASFVFRARSLPVAEGSLTSGTGDAFVAEPDLYVFVPNASGERSEVLPVTLNDTNPTILPIRVVTISDPETASVVEGMGTSDGLRVTFDQCVSSTHWTYGAGPDSGAGPDTSALDEATVTVVSGCAACVADGQAWCPGSTTCTCVARGSMCPGEPDAEGMPTETPALVVCGDAPCAAYPSEAQCGMQPSCGWCATTGVCVARGEGGALTGCAEGDAGWLGDR